METIPFVMLPERERLRVESASGCGAEYVEGKRRGWRRRWRRRVRVGGGEFS